MTTPFLRPQQLELIDMITSTRLRQCTAVEAPTGTGKTRAAMMAAAETGRAVIATSTKALSHQYKNEVKAVQANSDGVTFKVLSGKRAMGCTCPRYHTARCPWPRHLQEARAADVVITNFALLATVALGYIPSGFGPRDTIILDEAHEFAAPREQEPEDNPDSSSSTIYWQPADIADAILEGGARLACISATINADVPEAPDPFSLLSAGIPVHRSKSLPTPFNWDKQLTLHSVTAPAGNWSQFAVDTVSSLDNRGKLFITRSHREKNNVANALRNSGYEVITQADLGQGKPSQAKDITDSFNAIPNLCVVGTDTLMTGLDVPGDALGNIIICGPPNLYGRWTDIEEIHTRMARLNTTDILTSYLVPNRSLRLTQAIGRGIRSTIDTATVIVGCEYNKPVDNLIYQAAARRYGKA